MKAIRVEEQGEPDVMKLVGLPVPEVGEEDVLVEIRAAGINPVDTYIRAGIFGKKPPYTPGSDGAGVVKEIGPGVNRIRAGDRVFLTGSKTGTYAECALCKSSQVHPLPESITFAQGAALGVPYSTAYRALFQRGKVEPGETVLVHGASGGVGTAAVQLAHAAGIEVFGTAGSSAGRSFVRELGATHVFDHKDPSYRDAILSATKRRGVHCILEMLANVNLDHDLRLLAQRGRVVIIGSRGRIEIDPRETMTRDTDIRGMSLANASDDELAEIHQALVEALKNGTIRPVIEKELPLSDAPKGHRAVLSREAHGKIVLVP